MGAAESGTGETPEKFDDILGRLRGVVDRLEGGNLALEESLKTFEEGMALCRRGAELLDRAEKRVEVLLGGPGGEARVAPLDPGSSRAADE